MLVATLPCFPSLESSSAIASLLSRGPPATALTGLGPTSSAAHFEVLVQSLCTWLVSTWSLSCTLFHLRLWWATEGSSPHSQLPRQLFIILASFFTWKLHSECIVPASPPSSFLPEFRLCHLLG